MKDMLDRLSQADPNTFAAYVKLMRDCNMFIDARISPAILQAVLQEAITSRGWQCVILSCTDHSRAAINGAERGWGMRDKISEQEGDTPAHALLAAYLSAIEEQA